MGDINAARMKDNWVTMSSEEWRDLAGRPGCVRYNHSGFCELYIAGRPVARSEYTPAGTIFYRYERTLEVADSPTGD